MRWLLLSNAAVTKALPKVSPDIIPAMSTSTIAVARYTVNCRSDSSPSSPDASPRKKSSNLIARPGIARPRIARPRYRRKAEVQMKFL
jgi:hypothetical protein